MLVISAGIIGAVFGRGVMRRLHISDHAVHGFAIGIASHGIGTARAFQVSEQAGAFAALAMDLNGLITALSLPWIMPWVEGLFGRLSPARAHAPPQEPAEPDPTTKRPTPCCTPSTAGSTATCSSSAARCGSPTCRR